MRQYNIQDKQSYYACVQLGRTVRILCDSSSFVCAALELAHEGRLNSGAYGRKSSRITQVINQLHDVGLVVWADYRYRKISAELIDLVRECGEALGVGLGVDDRLRFTRGEIERIRIVFDLLSREQCWIMLERGYGKIIPRHEFIGECASAQVSLYFAKLRKVGLITKSGSKLYTTNGALLEMLTIIAGRAFYHIESARVMKRPKAIRDKRALPDNERLRRKSELEIKLAEAWRMVHEENASCYRIQKELGLSWWQMKKHGFPIAEGKGRLGTSVIVTKDGVEHPFTKVSHAARFLGVSQAQLSNVLAGRCRGNGYEVAIAGVAPDSGEFST